MLFTSEVDVYILFAYLQNILVLDPLEFGDKKYLIIPIQRFHS